MSQSVKIKKSEKLSNLPHPYTFERMREAILTINVLRKEMTPLELETLELLLDENAMQTIEASVKETKNALYESLEKAVRE